MTSTAETRGEYDLTAVPWIVTGAVKLGLIEAVLVLVFSLAARWLAGPLETAVCGLIVLVGLAAVTLLPGIWTRPRTIEGLAGAAGIGLAATAVFLLLDVMLLQNIGTYTDRWYAIGGGSNWWYHPVWWMTGTFLPWMGAWTLANQTGRSGRPAPAMAMLMAVGFAVIVAVLAILLGFPGARWTLGTFAVSFLPGLVIAVIVSGFGKRRT